MVEEGSKTLQRKARRGGFLRFSEGDDEVDFLGHVGGREVGVLVV